MKLSIFLTMGFFAMSLTTQFIFAADSSLRATRPIRKAFTPKLGGVIVGGKDCLIETKDITLKQISNGEYEIHFTKASNIVSGDQPTLISPILAVDSGSGSINRSVCTIAIPVQFNKAASVQFKELFISGFQSLSLPEFASFKGEVFFSGSRGESLDLNFVNFDSMIAYNFDLSRQSEIYVESGSSQIIRFNFSMIMKSDDHSFTLLDHLGLRFLVKN